MKSPSYVLLFTTTAGMALLRASAAEIPLTAERKTKTSTRLADCMRNAAHGQALHQYARAEQSYRQCYSFARRTFGENDEHTAVVLNRLGQMAYLQGNFLQAGGYFRTSMRAYESSPGNRISELVVVWNNLGATEEELGNYSKSLAYFRKVLDYYEANGPKDRGLAVGLSNYALVQASLGDVQEAAISAARAVDLLDHKRPSMDLAESLMTLGRIQILLNNYTSAGNALERARWCLAQIGGMETPTAAQVFTHLGRVYTATKRTAEAETLFQNSLRIQERVLNSQHPSLLLTLRSYAEMLRATGRKREAKRLEARFRDGAERSQQQTITNALVDVHALKREQAH